MQMLRCRTGTRIETWESFLSVVFRDLNNRHHGVLRMSPYRATFGFDQRTPLVAELEGALPAILPSSAMEQHLSALIGEFHASLESISKVVFSRSVMDQSSRAALQLSRLGTLARFSIGDHVFIRNVATPAKGQSHFSPVPYRVISATEYDTYGVESCLSARVRTSAHASHLVSVDISRVSIQEILLFAVETGEGIVERIVGHRVMADDSLAFHVQWVNHHEPTWEPAEGLRALLLFQQYCKEKGLEKCLRTAPKPRNG
jgi:hypothetical protein